MSVRYSRYLPAFIFITDILLLNISVYFVYISANGYFPADGRISQFILVVNMCWCIISGLSKSYSVPRPLILSENVNKFIVTLIYHLVAVLGIIYFFQLYYVPRLEFLLSNLLFFVLALTGRSALYFTLDYARKKGFNHRQIVVLGDDLISARLIKSFSDHPEYGYDLLYTITDQQLSGISTDSLIARLDETRPDELFICYRQMNRALLQQLFTLGKKSGIKIKVVTDLELSGNYASLVSYHNIPVLQITAHPPIGLKIRVLKRTFDLTFSLIVMTFGMPVFVILYVVTRLSSKGPAFYKQERVGKDEKPFVMYKFRSMYTDAEKCGPQLSSDDDPRVTKWGRIMRSSRLDELPQFWNVLIGEMSVVGPRPERQHFIEQIIEKSPGYKKLFAVKPGLTSIGQVHYGYAENVEQMRERLRYDLLYLNNVNFSHELEIIAKTVRVMLQRKGK
jgi:exopolysaccharide biosynthesis polyprenyl glycosylphosphotransferase